MKYTLISFALLCLMCVLFAFTIYTDMHIAGGLIAFITGLMVADLTNN